VIKPRLTILLPLKGRHLHTLRFLWHANRVRLPYHFLIADGEVHPAIADLLKEPLAVFPNLSIDYVRYPDDVDYSLFYKKMADAAARVRTPYVMQADNDDFPIASGIDHCIERLDANPEFASYGGGIGGFRLQPNADPTLRHVVGAVESVAFRFMGEYLPEHYTGATAGERVRQAFEKTHTFYYNVFRSQHLAAITRELAELDFTDLQLHEIYFGMRAKTFGMACSDGTVVSYFRQGGTATVVDFRVDWVSHLLRSRYTSDFANLLNRIAAVIEHVDRNGDPGVSEAIRTLYADRLRGQLRDTFRPPARPPMKMALKSWLLSQLSPQYRRKRQRNAVLRELAGVGASEQYLSTFDGEWAEVEATLDGDDFVEFVKSRAPALTNAGAEKRCTATIATES